MPVYAVFSDVHGQDRNLEHALAYLQSRRVDGYLQLGDLGVSPLSLLAGLPVQHTFGNWEVSGLGQFPQAQQPVIAAWPAQISGETWIASHATPVFPAQCYDLASTRRYMAEHHPRWTQLFPSLLHDEHAIWAAVTDLEERDKLVAFHGHTHMQAVQRFDQEAHLHRVSDRVIELHPGTRTLIGVGSLGVPRDGGDLRCVLFDTDASQVELLAIPAP